MKLMDRLKALFLRSDIPAETRDAFARASTPAELVRILEDLSGRNGIELKRAEQDLFAVSEALGTEEARIRQGGLAQVVKTSVLRTIERLRKQRDNLDARASIFNGNINLHLNLIARIQEMEAMELRGVKEDDIDEILTDVQEELQEYRRDIQAGREGEPAVTTVGRSAEQERLDDLERELTGTGKKRDVEPKPKKPDLE